MTRLRTITDFQDAIDAEHAWRLKELANYVLTIRTKESPARRVLVRAGVPLVYAHWEGFVKCASLTYLKYVGDQRLRYADLSPCFVVFGVKRHLGHLVSSKKSRLNIQAVEFFTESMNERANLVLAKAVNTESNLSSSVFEDIALSLGIDSEPYRTKFNLIDESLLNRRNRIAHGEFLDIEADEFRTLTDQVIGLMRCYKNDILNAASSSAYRR